MKIALIGPGIMSIPPNGWGAVEMMIWDHYKILTKNGFNVDIINTPSRNDIINLVNGNSYDVVHIHYDVFSDIILHLNSRVRIISSHYPFINNPEKWNSDGYDIQMKNLVNNSDFFIFASSQNDINTFVKFGAYEDRTFLSRLGVKVDSYNFDSKHTYDRTLSFSQITPRKRQSIIQYLDNIDFMGRLDDPSFVNHKNYKGEVSRDFLNSEITKYSNFILISSVENTTPLAVKEALMCGLGVVVSESVALELDVNLDFITIIEENKINDIAYISSKIEENKIISKSKRSDIRKYAIEKFDVEVILMDEYIKKIESLL